MRKNVKVDRSLSTHVITTCYGLHLHVLNYLLVILPQYIICTCTCTLTISYKYLHCWVGNHYAHWWTNLHEIHNEIFSKTSITVCTHNKIVFQVNSRDNTLSSHLTRPISTSMLVSILKTIMIIINLCYHGNRYMPKKATYENGEKEIHTILLSNQVTTTKTMKVM